MRPDVVRTTMHWPWFVVLLALLVRADPCIYTGKTARGQDDKVDLAPVFANGPLSIDSVVPTPPSRTRTQVQIDLCNPLPMDKAKSAEDQCPDGTLVCLSVTNEKHGENRIEQVVPAATKAETSKLAETLERKPARANAPRFVIHLAAPSWGEIAQKTQVQFFCSPEHKEPIARPSDHLSWDSKAPLALDILSSEVCRGRRPSTSPGFFRSIGLLISFFFWVALAALVLYLLGGIWVNYNHYGARGWDLLPNRDFWRETPYLARDAFRHVFRSASSGSGGARSGYDPI